ncbi:MAG: hypothetical protein ABI601_20730 [bacterium]
MLASTRSSIMMSVALSSPTVALDRAIAVAEVDDVEIAAPRSLYVAVHGADTIQQLLNAGLLDEILVDVAAVLLGSGVRLFANLEGTPAVLRNPTVVAGVGVTHLRYPVRFTANAANAA